jgi:O-antigen ligase
VGGFRVTVYDVLLMVAVLSAWRSRPRARARPLLPIVAAVVMVGIVLGRVNGAPIDVLVDEARSVLYLLAGLMLSRWTTSDELVARGAWLVGGILWVSLAMLTAGALFGIPIAAVEGQAHLAQGLGTAGSSAIAFSATRYVTVTTHLAVFVLAALLYGAALPVRHDGYRAQPVALMALLVPAFVLTVLSYSRNTILGLVAALLFTLMATRSLHSYVRLAVKGVSAIAVVGAVAFLFFPTSVRSMGASYVGRVLAGASPESLDIDTGVQFRLVETEYAISTVQEHPLLGIGLGTSYRPDLAHDPFPPEASAYARGYVHNWYLWLATKLGLIGAAPLILLILFALLRALAGPPSSATLGSGLAAIVAVGLVWPTLRSAGMALLVGLVAGCLLDSRIAGPTRRRADRHRSGVTSGSFDSPSDVRTLTVDRGGAT